MTLAEHYQAFEDLFADGDPRVTRWPLVSKTPLPVTTLICGYLLVLYIGIKLMKNRQPFNLQKILVIYNFGLVVFSCYILTELLLSITAAKYSLVCQDYDEDHSNQDPKEFRVTSVIWVFYFSKAVELLDTILMILRKKNDQITFLHVYHHMSMLCVFWVVLRFHPGGEVFMVCLLNTFVHIIMYTYYGMSAIPSLRKHLWWKKYLTKLQMIQFIVMLGHIILVNVKCQNIPRWGFLLYAFYLPVMLVLFGNFYLQAYIKRRRENAHTDGVLLSRQNKHQYSNGDAHQINGKID